MGTSSAATYATPTSHVSAAVQVPAALHAAAFAQLDPARSTLSVTYGIA
jgi:hypothetical protein